MHTILLILQTFPGWVQLLTIFAICYIFDILQEVSYRLYPLDISKFYINTETILCMNHSHPQWVPHPHKMLYKVCYMFFKLIFGHVFCPFGPTLKTSVKEVWLLAIADPILPQFGKKHMFYYFFSLIV